MHYCIKVTFAITQIFRGYKVPDSRDDEVVGDCMFCLFVFVVSGFFSLLFRMSVVWASFLK